jgi:poly-gamma-glutamate synthesis protein (capsule biosynthesis protein)
VGDKVVVNFINKNQISLDLEAARKYKPDAIIVLYHFGQEYLRQPDHFQKEMTDFAFSEGADIVLGGHPHVLQPFELFTIKDKYGNSRNRLVMYSLENFLSGQQRRYTDAGIVFYFTVSKINESLQIHKIHYEPVWVYEKKTATRKDYQVLPVKKYLTNNQPMHLEKEAYQKMKLFYEDTKVHFNESEQKVQEKAVISDLNNPYLLTNQITD